MEGEGVGGGGRRPSGYSLSPLLAAVVGGPSMASPWSWRQGSEREGEETGVREREEEGFVPMDPWLPELAG